MDSQDPNYVIFLCYKLNIIAFWELVVSHEQYSGLENIFYALLRGFITLLILLASEDEIIIISSQFLSEHLDILVRSTCEKPVCSCT